MPAPLKKIQLTIFQRFFRTETLGGVVLLAFALAALVIANSPSAGWYNHLWETPLKVGIVHCELSLSLHDWINDGLMAVFFLLVGLEIKREILEGQLSSWGQRALPGAAALGGMMVPALIYLAFNTGSPETLRGWAIPAATDIAFALGVLALLGPRVPVSLKVFLTSLAIIDDLGSVAIIAAVYTHGLSPIWFGVTAATIAALVTFNAWGLQRLLPYLVAGVALWFFVFKSGVHATLAGVAL